METTEGGSEKQESQNTGTLSRSLRLLYVYAMSTGAILTFIGYWDGLFLKVGGPAAFLSFFLMTLAIIPIAFVYSELAAMLPNVGAELLYNTIGINKHAGFWSSWLIMGAWIAVPPAAVMGILDWLDFAFRLNMAYTHKVSLGAVVLVLYCGLSLMKNVVAGKVQTCMLFLALGGVVVTALIFITSEYWSLSHFTPLFRSTLNEGGSVGIKGWILGTALIITPFFGFETVPQMVEEGTFPIKSMYKAIIGSVVTCGALYVLFFFALAGMGPWEELTELGKEGDAPFAAIKIIEDKFGWRAYGIFFGVVGVLFTIGTCLLGFWYSTVRLLYAMGRQNFLPKSFSKLNRHSQPIVANILIMLLSLGFIAIQSKTNYLSSYFSIMALACALAYCVTMVSAIRLAVKNPHWERPFKLKAAMAVRTLALLLAVSIALLVSLVQSPQGWISFGLYLGIGLLLWLWMVVFKWPKETVWMQTPEGDKEF